jgi:secondary thiamine-phosphate synthase enzyme
MQFTVATSTRDEMIDITPDIQSAITHEGIKEGLCFVFVPHTTAAVTINENADRDVRRDLKSIFNKIIPWEDGYRHVEGNSAAHMKTTLVGSSEMVAIENGKLVLGTWQSLFFCEFDGPRTRKVIVKFL